MVPSIADDLGTRNWRPACRAVCAHWRLVEHSLASRAVAAAAATRPFDRLAAQRTMLGNGRADDRRRRVLTEELIVGSKSTDDANSSEASPRAAGSRSANRYGEAARTERQPRLVDLLPRHYGWISLVFMLGAGFIAALQAGHYYLPRLVSYSASGKIAVLDLAGGGNLAAWFSTALLTAAAVTAWVVYGIRKHRADDYHGGYRIWYAAALAWLFVSVDEAAGLHETFRDLAVGLSGELALGSGSVWWLSVYALVFGFIGVRLALEMRECRISTTLLLLVGMLYASAAGLLLNGEMHWFPPIAGVEPVMLEAGLTASADLLLLISHLVHARYVVLEAEGEIKPRLAKPKVEKTPKAAKPAKEPAVKAAARLKEEKTEASTSRGGLFGWMRQAKIDSPHSVPAPVRKSSDLSPAAKSSNQVPSSAFEEADEPRTSHVKRVRPDFMERDDEEEEDGEPREGRKLSKSERKAMRRQKEMERRGYGG